MILSNPLFLKAAIYIALDCDIPLNIFGTTGIGKSSIVAEVAQEWADDVRGLTSYVTLTGYDDPRSSDTPFHFVDLRLAHQDISDWGIPVIDKDNMRSTKTCPSWIPQETHMERVTNKTPLFVLFADELNRGSTEAINAMMSIVMERRLGPYSLPKVNRLVAACNPSVGPYDTDTLDGAMKARWAHILYKVGTQSYLEERKAYLDPALIKLLNQTKWLDDSQKKALGNWTIEAEISPCPRTFELASRLVNYLFFIRNVMPNREHRYYSALTPNDFEAIVSTIGAGLLPADLAKAWSEVAFKYHWVDLDRYFESGFPEENHYVLLQGLKMWIPFLEKEDVFRLEGFCQALCLNPLVNKEHLLAVGSKLSKAKGLEFGNIWFSFLEKYQGKILA